VRQGNVFYEGGSLRESLQRYQQALALLLEDEALARRVTENIRDAGYSLLAAGDQQSAEMAARLAAVEKERDAALARANQLATVEKERDAALARASQLPAVEKERDAALARLNALSASEQERLNRQAALEKERDAALARASQLATVEKERDAALARASQLSAVEKERDAALARLSALSASEQERLNRLAALEKERDAALAKLSQAAAVEQQRAAVLARLRDLRVQYQAYAALQPAAAASELDSPQSLSTLLQAKILVRQILDTEPVRSRYPQLNATMERYFTALAAQKQADGRRAALQELDALLARLNALGQPGSPEFTSYRRGSEPDPLLALLNRLEALLR
jgi:hypothetical protein